MRRIQLLFQGSTIPSFSNLFSSSYSYYSCHSPPAGNSVVATTTTTTTRCRHNSYYGTIALRRTRRSSSSSRLSLTVTPLATTAFQVQPFLDTNSRQRHGRSLQQQLSQQEKFIMIPSFSSCLTTTTAATTPIAKFHLGRSTPLVVRRWTSSLSSTASSSSSSSSRKDSSGNSSNSRHLGKTKKSSPKGTTTRSTTRTATERQEAMMDIFAQESEYKRPVLQWYPGHIGKAERMLKESFISAVDVIVEVRDARIPKATSHPKVGLWCAGKPRVVVLTHVDQVSKASQRAWTKAYQLFGAEHYASQAMQDKQARNRAKQAAQERAKYQKNDKYDDNNRNDNQNSLKTKTTTNQNQEENNNNNNNNQHDQSSSPIKAVIFVNAKEGAGIHNLKRTLFRAGSFVQERRARRGLKARPLRVGILGFPNVGKSALINRLLGRRRARAANTPGVTRSLQWIRIRNNDDLPNRYGISPSISSNNDKNSNNNNKAGEFELLDSPGIIPLDMQDSQSDATLLAACNCIGQAAYDNQEVAAYLCEWMLTLHRLGYAKRAAPGWRSAVMERYKFDPLTDQVDTLLRPPSFYNNDDDDDNDNKDDNSNNKKDDRRGTKDHVRSSKNYETIERRRQRTGEDMLHTIADRTCQGDLEDASRKILQDFRTGRMGPICLQMAPKVRHDPGQVPILHEQYGQYGHDHVLERQAYYKVWEQKEQNERAQTARRVAEEMGLALPPVLLEQEVAQQQQREQQQQQPEDDENSNNNNNNDNKNNNKSGKTTPVVEESNIGRGLFDGW